MDLAFVDTLASQNNGVNYLLVAVDVFSRYVRVPTMKTKYAKDTLQAFRKNTSRKNAPEKLWVDKRTEYAGTFKKEKRKRFQKEFLKRRKTLKFTQQ